MQKTGHPGNREGKVILLMNQTIVFIHGLESTARGNKGRYFRAHFPQMIIEDYQGNFDCRMQKLREVLAGKSNLVLVGSSYGGLMAATFALEDENRVKKLILLAPALNLKEFPSIPEKKLQVPVVIFHGKHDDVVDPGTVRTIADETFSNLDYHLIDDDHPLSVHFPKLDWKTLLEQT